MKDVPEIVDCKIVRGAYIERYGTNNLRYLQAYHLFNEVNLDNENHSPTPERNKKISTPHPPRDKTAAMPEGKLTDAGAWHTNIIIVLKPIIWVLYLLINPRLNITFDLLQ